MSILTVIMLWNLLFTLISMVFGILRWRQGVELIKEKNRDA